MRTHHQTRQWLLLPGLLVCLLASSQALAISRYPTGLSPTATNTHIQQLSENAVIGRVIWNNLNQEFSRLYEQGQYQQALESAQHSHRVAVQLYGVESINSADSLVKLGIVYQAMGRFIYSKYYFEQSLSTLKKILSPDDPAIAVTLTNLGNLYFKLNNFTASEYAHRKALKLRRNAYGEISAEAAQSYFNLGVLYGQLNDYSKAIQHYQMAIDLWRKTLGESHPYVGSALQNLTSIYVAQQQYSEAARSQQQVVSFKQTVLGENHPAVASAFIDLAALYSEQRHFLPASEAYRAALRITEKENIRENPQIALLLYSLANAYHMQARTDATHDDSLLNRALPFYERALASVDQLHTPEPHPALPIILRELALLYSELGEDSKANATETRLASLTH